MSRTLPPEMTPRRMRWRARLVPVATTMAGSAAAILPVVAERPLLPAAGLMMLLGWRLLRPEIWPAWAALPLGLFDDLMTGHPPGTAPLLWTALFVALDVADRWIVWRTGVQDWAIGAAGILFAGAGAFAIGLATGGGGTILTLVPQILASILLLPLAQRLCARLDRWRLLA